MKRISYGKKVFLAEVNYISLQKNIVFPFKLVGLLGNKIISTDEDNDEKSIIKQRFNIPKVTKLSKKCFKKQRLLVQQIQQKDIIIIVDFMIDYVSMQLES